MFCGVLFAVCSLMSVILHLFYIYVLLCVTFIAWGHVCVGLWLPHGRGVCAHVPCLRCYAAAVMRA